MDKENTPASMPQNMEETSATSTSANRNDMGGNICNIQKKKMKKINSGHGN